MANYPQELAQDAVCQGHTGHMTGLWFLPTRPLRLNTNEWMNEWMNECEFWFGQQRQRPSEVSLTEWYKLHIIWRWHGHWHSGCGHHGYHIACWTVLTFRRNLLLPYPTQLQTYVRSIYLNINQLDALNFIMSLFHASTCFEHMCLSSGGQNCTIQPLVSSHLYVAVPCTGHNSTCVPDGHLQVWWYQRLYSTILTSWRWAHVLEICRGMK